MKKKIIMTGLLCFILQLLLFSVNDTDARGADLKAGEQEKQTLLSESGDRLALPVSDGEYSISLTMSGGSGKAMIESPAYMRVQSRQAVVTLVFSSSNYDYMLVDGKKYLNQSEEGMNSSFEVPIDVFDQEIPVIADTLAMGTPHEIEYELYFDSASIGSKGQLPREAAKRVLIAAVIIIVAGGILNYFVQKKRRC